MVEKNSVGLKVVCDKSVRSLNFAQKGKFKNYIGISLFKSLIHPWLSLSMFNSKVKVARDTNLNFLLLLIMFYLDMVNYPMFFLSLSTRTWDTCLLHDT